MLKVSAVISTIAVALFGLALAAEGQKAVLSDREQAISDRIRGLRAVPDERRGEVTKQIALEIRALPASPLKIPLASGLANLATEGDFGRQTLQEVATTLAESLRAQSGSSVPEGPYATLAQLVRYEGVAVPMDDPLLKAALARLEAKDKDRAAADFTLSDIKGGSWTLHDLRGKVVLVNFWATWCPPCRKEMPDLDALYREFAPKGLVILAISDEDAAKVNPFIAEHKYSYPILLDPGRKVNQRMHVEGIPKSFVYDREGRLVAEAIDMRTRGQLLEMLSHAGLK